MTVREAIELLSKMQPVANANLCPTCETFQEGMRGLFYPELGFPLETKHHDKETLGMLIVSLSAFCVVVFILWIIFQ